jgi:hypothetical protein
LLTVKLLPKFGLETMTRGYRLVNKVATAATVPSAVIAKASALLRAATKTTAMTSAPMPITAGRTGGKTSLSFRSTATATVQIKKPTPRRAAGTDSRRAAWAARSQRTPLVLKVRKVAPWKAKMATNARPATTV